MAAKYLQGCTVTERKAAMICWFNFLLATTMKLSGRYLGALQNLGPVRYAMALCLSNMKLSPIKAFLAFR